MKTTIILITIILFIILIILILNMFFQRIPDKKYKTTTININGVEFNAQISDTVSKKQLGLSGRESIKDNSGMLFIFKNKSQPTFWMYRMKFPIDVMWIFNNKIVDISKNIQPPTVANSIKKMKSSEKINKAFEVNAGIVEKYNIKIGDSISIFPY